MNFFLVIITAVPLVVGCITGLRRARPCLLFTSIGLLLWFVVIPGMTFLKDPWIGYAAAVTKAQLLALIWSSMFVGGSWFYEKWRGYRQKTAEAAMIAAQRIYDPRTLLIAAGACSLIAFVAASIFGALSTGSAWTRQATEAFSGMGLLTVVGSNMLIFSVVAFYLWRAGYQLNILVYFLAFLNLLVVLPGLIFSGTTGGPLAFLMPFAVIWAMKGLQFGVLRLFVVCVGGYAGVWFLRFMRLIGQLTLGGRVSIRLSDALSLYETSVLRPSQSFGEFFWFTQAVAYVDSGGTRMAWRPYAYMLTQFIPGVFWPGKSAVIAASRPDWFMRDVVLQGQFGGLIPVGMYGEAYLSYGLLTFIPVAILLGMLCGYVDARYRTSLWRLPGPLVCALMCPLFIGTCRGSVQYFASGVVPIILLSIAALILQPLTPKRTTEMPAGERLFDEALSAEGHE